MAGTMVNREVPKGLTLEYNSCMNESELRQKIDKLKCPKCQSELKPGYIAGHWIPQRWTEKANTKTIMAGLPLNQDMSWLNAPTVIATRCEKCKIGIFSYDNDSKKIGQVLKLSKIIPLMIFVSVIVVALSIVLAG